MMNGKFPVCELVGGAGIKCYLWEMTCFTVRFLTLFRAVHRQILRPTVQFVSLWSFCMSLLSCCISLWFVLTTVPQCECIWLNIMKNSINTCALKRFSIEFVGWFCPQCFTFGTLPRGRVFNKVIIKKTNKVFNGFLIIKFLLLEKSTNTWSESLFLIQEDKEVREDKRET